MGGPVVIYPPYIYFNAGPIVITLGIEGELFNQVIPAGPIEIVITVEGVSSASTVIPVDPIVIVVSIEASYILVEPSAGWGVGVGDTGWMTNWVWWSKIGYADFTVDHSNVSGRRPMDWKGTVYEIIKLNDTVVVYGSNGVTVMKPSEVHWGMRTISKIGIANKGAAIGTDTEHYFIDRENVLWQLTSQGLKRLDYSEYLETMTTHILTLDLELGLLYICDGEIGFVYSTRTGSLGLGPSTVTGLGSQDSLLYVAASDEIVYPKFHICTDIYDLGTRKPKTIEQIEVGTNLTNNLEVMIETRIKNKSNFFKSVWRLVNPSGIAYLPCYGIEFKFHLRSFKLEYLELDYLKVSGVVHGAEYLDSSRESV
jgi:hypothetical protein